MELIQEFIAAYWKPVFEIALLTAFIYYMFLLFRGTRGAALSVHGRLASFRALESSRLVQESPKRVNNKL